MMKVDKEKDVCEKIVLKLVGDDFYTEADRVYTFIQLQYLPCSEALNVGRRSFSFLGSPRICQQTGKLSARSISQSAIVSKLNQDSLSEDEGDDEIYPVNETVAPDIEWELNEPKQKKRQRNREKKSLITERTAMTFVREKYHIIFSIHLDDLSYLVRRVAPEQKKFVENLLNKPSKFFRDVEIVRETFLRILKVFLKVPEEYLDLSFDSLFYVTVFISLNGAVEPMFVNRIFRPDANLDVDATISELKKEFIIKAFSLKKKKAGRSCSNLQQLLWKHRLKGYPISIFSLKAVEILSSKEASLAFSETLSPSVINFSIALDSTEEALTKALWESAILRRLHREKRLFKHVLKHQVLKREFSKEISIFDVIRLLGHLGYFLDSFEVDPEANSIFAVLILELGAGECLTVHVSAYEDGVVAYALLISPIEGFDENESSTKIQCESLKMAIQRLAAFPEASERWPRQEPEKFMLELIVNAILKQPLVDRFIIYNQEDPLLINLLANKISKFSVLKSSKTVSFVVMGKLAGKIEQLSPNAALFEIRALYLGTPRVLDKRLSRVKQLLKKGSELFIASEPQVGSWIYDTVKQAQDVEGSFVSFCDGYFELINIRESRSSDLTLDEISLIVESFSATSTLEHSILLRNDFMSSVPNGDMEGFRNLCFLSKIQEPLVINLFYSASEVNLEVFGLNESIAPPDTTAINSLIMEFENLVQEVRLQNRFRLNSTNEITLKKRDLDHLLDSPFQIGLQNACLCKFSSSNISPAIMAFWNQLKDTIQSSEKVDAIVLGEDVQQPSLAFLWKTQLSEHLMVIVGRLVQWARETGVVFSFCQIPEQQGAMSVAPFSLPTSTMIKEFLHPLISVELFKATLTSKIWSPPQVLFDPSGTLKQVGNEIMFSDVVTIGQLFLAKKNEFMPHWLELCDYLKNTMMTDDQENPALICEDPRAGFPTRWFAGREAISGFPLFFKLESVKYFPNNDNLVDILQLDIAERFQGRPKNPSSAAPYLGTVSSVDERYSSLAIFLPPSHTEQEFEAIELFHKRLNSRIKTWMLEKLLLVLEELSHDQLSFFWSIMPEVPSEFTFDEVVYVGSKHNHVLKDKKLEPFIRSSTAVSKCLDLYKSKFEVGSLLLENPKGSSYVFYLKSEHSVPCWCSLIVRSRSVSVIAFHTKSELLKSFTHSLIEALNETFREFLQKAYIRNLMDAKRRLIIITLSQKKEYVALFKSLQGKSIMDYHVGLPMFVYKKKLFSAYDLKFGRRLLDYDSKLYVRRLSSDQGGGYLCFNIIVQDEMRQVKFSLIAVSDNDEMSRDKALLEADNLFEELKLVIEECFVDALTSIPADEIDHSVFDFLCTFPDLSRLSHKLSPTKCGCPILVFELLMTRIQPTFKPIKSSCAPNVYTENITHPASWAMSSVKYKSTSHPASIAPSFAHSMAASCNVGTTTFPEPRILSYRDSSKGSSIAFIRFWITIEKSIINIHWEVVGTNDFVVESCQNSILSELPGAEALCEIEAWQSNNRITLNGGSDSFPPLVIEGKKNVLDSCSFQFTWALSKKSHKDLASLLQRGAACIHDIGADNFKLFKKDPKKTVVFGFTNTTNAIRVRHIFNLFDAKDSSKVLDKCRVKRKINPFVMYEVNQREVLMFSFLVPTEVVDKLKILITFSCQHILMRNMLLNKMRIQLSTPYLQIMCSRIGLLFVTEPDNFLRILLSQHAGDFKDGNLHNIFLKNLKERTVMTTTAAALLLADDEVPESKIASWLKAFQMLESSEKAEEKKKLSSTFESPANCFLKSTDEKKLEDIHSFKDLLAIPDFKKYHPLLCVIFIFKWIKKTFRLQYKESLPFLPHASTPDRLSSTSVSRRIDIKVVQGVVAASKIHQTFVFQIAPKKRDEFYLHKKQILWGSVTDNLYENLTNRLKMRGFVWMECCERNSTVVKPKNNLALNIGSIQTMPPEDQDIAKTLVYFLVKGEKLITAVIAPAKEPGQAQLNVYSVTLSNIRMSEVLMSIREGKNITGLLSSVKDTTIDNFFIELTRFLQRFQIDIALKILTFTLRTNTMFLKKAEEAVVVEIVAFVTQILDETSATSMPNYPNKKTIRHTIAVSTKPDMSVEHLRENLGYISLQRGIKMVIAENEDKKPIIVIVSSEIPSANSLKSFVCLFSEKSYTMPDDKHSCGAWNLKAYIFDDALFHIAQHSIKALFESVSQESLESSEKTGSIKLTLKKYMKLCRLYSTDQVKHTQTMLSKLYKPERLFEILCDVQTKSTLYKNKLYTTISGYHHYWGISVLSLKEGKLQFRIYVRKDVSFEEPTTRDKINIYLIEFEQVLDFAILKHLSEPEPE